VNFSFTCLQKASPVANGVRTLLDPLTNEDDLLGVIGNTRPERVEEAAWSHTHPPFISNRASVRVRVVKYRKPIGW
jgi:hypothetical protein